MRYLLAPARPGSSAPPSCSTRTREGRRWSLATRNSQELPLGLHAEIDTFFQSDREYIANQGKTIEERSSERTTSSFYIDRSWSAWNSPSRAATRSACSPRTGRRSPACPS